MPILIRQTGLTGRWVALTRYKRVEKFGRNIIESIDRHELDEADFFGALVSAGWTPPDDGAKSLVGGKDGLP